MFCCSACDHDSDCSLYPSSFKLQVCCLHSLTRITDLCQLIGTLSFAAFLHLEIYWVYLVVIVQIAGVLPALTHPNH
ncbi:hypothetical protein CS535_11730 [Yersinia massiliensis]|nr:hypothetical protein B4902_15320 [Yersinia frederiksenii]PHZ23626.1 hypothetical protein CS535_11730 [Yersinia massiliensis]